MDFEGLSGRIRYESGRRFDFNLDLLHLTQNGLRKVRFLTPSVWRELFLKYYQVCESYNLARLNTLIE